MLQIEDYESELESELTDGEVVWVVWEVRFGVDPEHNVKPEQDKQTAREGKTGRIRSTGNNDVNMMVFDINALIYWRDQKIWVKLYNND